MEMTCTSVYLDVWEQSVQAALHGYGTVSGLAVLRVMPGDNVNFE